MQSNIYATHPDESLRPTEIEYEDTTFFDKRGIFEEPKKKYKYDSNFEMQVGLHYNQIRIQQDLLISKNKIKNENF